MVTTVSRRFVFVKVKRKQPPRKPRPPIRDDDEMVGEAARPARPLLIVSPSQVAERKSPWPLVAAAVGGFAAVAVVIALLSGLAGRPTADGGVQVQAARSAAPTHPGYSRSASGGYPGAGGGYSNGSGSGGDRAVVRQTSAAEAFLSSPFPNRKPVSCAAQMDGSSESRRDFSKCLEQANEREPAPGAK